MSTDEMQQNVPASTEPSRKKKCVGVTREAKITVLATENTKRGASSERFQNYFDKKPSTVQEAIDCGLTMADIHYDFIKGFINVEGAQVVEYTPSRRGPRTPGGSKKSKSKAMSEDVLDDGADLSSEGF